jgi:hypothetical protein
MYERLVKRQEASRSVDSGMDLIAAGLAQEKNRPALIQMAGAETGGVSGAGAGEQFKTLMDIRKDEESRANFAAMGKDLPAIATKWGIDLPTVQYLYRSGKLQETLNDIAKGSTEVVERADGSKVLVDKRTGKPVGEDIGPAKIEKPVIHTLPNGDQVAVDPLDPGNKDKWKPIGNKPAPDPNIITLPDGRQVAVDPRDPGNKEKWKEIGVKPKAYKFEKGPGGSIIALDENDPNFRKDIAAPTTDDIVEYENDKARGGPAKDMSLFQWLLETKKAGAAKTSVEIKGDEAGSKAAAENFAKTYDDQYKTAAAGTDTITAIQNTQNAMDAPGGIISGSALSGPTRTARKVVADVLGIEDKATENSEVFFSNIRSIVLPKLKQTGSGAAISNTDREFIDQMMGGSGDMPPEAIKRILVIQEKIERAKIRKYGSDVQKLREERPEIGKNTRDVQLPQPSAHLKASVPAKAVERLLKERDTKEFDQMYGEGMADVFLGGK